MFANEFFVSSSFTEFNYKKTIITCKSSLMEIFKEFTFDSAHFLPNVPDGHKCKEIHGHTYRLVVYIHGEPDKYLGWVMDFEELKRLVKPIIDRIDHKLLNNIPGLENPTCEFLIIWLWDQIKPLVPHLSRLKLHETPTSGAIYSGPTT